MKQPEDRYTMELIQQAVKRGRGRPRKDNALTPAQRAKSYRDRIKVKASTPVNYGKKRVCLNGTAPSWARGYYVQNCATQPPACRQVMGSLGYGCRFS